jgi:hypothetical protein
MSLDSPHRDGSENTFCDLVAGLIAVKLQLQVQLSVFIIFLLDFEDFGD